MAKKTKKHAPKKAVKHPSAQSKPATHATEGAFKNRPPLEYTPAARRLFYAFAILLPFVVLAYYPSYQAFYNDYDIWFHLAYGKHYVENLTWHIDHSVYSWTPAIAQATYVTWLGSSALYIIHNAFGVTGLFILQYAVILAAGAIVWRFAKTAGIRPGMPLLAGLLLTALVMGTAANHIKPELFSILFVTLTAAIYLRFRMSPSPWAIIAFPALFLFWVNTHGLWQFGIIFLGIVFAADLLLYAIRRSQALPGRALIYLGAAAALTFAALCVNPFGASYPIGFVTSRLAGMISVLLASKESIDVMAASAINSFGPVLSGSFLQEGISRILSFLPFSGGGSGEALAHYRGVRAYLNLWEHLFYGQRQPFLTMTAAGMAAMIITFLVAWAAAFKRTGKMDIPVIAANIAFFFMAMFMGRLALVFALIWIVSMIFTAWRAGPEPLFPRARPLAAAAFLGLTAYVAVAVIYIYEDRSWFGAGHEIWVPDREVHYIMDNDLPGPMFNDYLAGSYLIWTMYPEYKVAIDGRHFPYAGQVFADWAGIGSKYPLNPQGLRTFTDKYPARIALIHHNYQNLIRWFERSPDWALAYFDVTAIVMVHRSVVQNLPPSAIGAMHAPDHYKDISNPVVLGYLFDVYQRFSGGRHAAQIRDYYEQNVPDRYWNKQNTLTNMDRFLARMRQEGRW